mmetsp:Transcript_18656/g.55310  ORF Transcript_18656/g.55310 Transcript_18656/m.55310 type:complete len:316 (-) Transcript_18656:101-1048(-)
MDCGGMYDTQSSYNRINDHIGCHSRSCPNSNCGFIGRPRDFLPDVTSTCGRGQSTQCIALGMAACDLLNARGQDCWGFGVHNGWGVQVYNSNASNAGGCTGSNNLQQNGAWDTFRRTASACAPPASSRHSCDFLGDVSDQSWTCDCVPRTAAPTQQPTLPTTTTATTATTHTALQDQNRSIRALFASQQTQQTEIDRIGPQIAALVSTVAQLGATVTAMSAAQAAQVSTTAAAQSRIVAALGALPTMVASAPPANVTCPGPDSRCTPQVVAGNDGSLTLTAAAARVTIDTAACSVDVCDLRASLRQVVSAFNTLG